MAVTKERIAEHIARVQAALDIFNIKDPRFILNLEECGISFRESGRRLKAKAVGRNGSQLLSTVVKTQNVEHVTVMGIGNAAGDSFKPVIVFPGTNQHFQRVKGRTEGLLTHLPPCYAYKRDPAGVDSATFYDWAKEFVFELDRYRPSGQNVLLVYDGYKCHIQYRVLKMFRENGIYVISLPAHTSHVLQPLDQSVFGPFKDHLQRYLRGAARVTKRLHPFQIARLIKFALSDAFTASNLQSGFEKTGIWDRRSSSTYVRLLEELPFYDDEEDTPPEPVPMLKTVVEKFNDRARSLLRDVEIEKSGTLRVDTKKWGAFDSTESGG